MIEVAFLQRRVVGNGDATGAHTERPHLGAMTNGLTLPHTSGMVDGPVNRVKLLKRQGYGRASFDLLRRRILLTP